MKHDEIRIPFKEQPVEVTYVKKLVATLEQERAEINAENRAEAALITEIKDQLSGKRAVQPTIPKTPRKSIKQIDADIAVSLMQVK